MEGGRGMGSQRKMRRQRRTGGQRRRKGKVENLATTTVNVRLDSYRDEVCASPSPQ